MSKALKLAKEYRRTMPLGLIHLWASDSVRELRRLADVNADLLEALQALESAFMVHTRWNGEPIAEIKAARAAIKKATE